MTLDSSAVYHDGTYLAEHPDWHEADAPWKAAHIARLLADHELHPTTVIDVGCGTGGVLRALHRAGVAERYIGYEISAQALQLAQDLTPPGSPITFRRADILTTPPDEPFDLVLNVDVFEHVEDYLGFLRRLARVGRHHVFHIPLDLSVQTVLRARPMLVNRRRLGHLHYFTRETALATVADAGYEVIEERYTAVALDRGDGLTPKARLLRLPRRIGATVAPHLSARVLGGWSLLVLARPAE